MKTRFLSSTTRAAAFAMSATLTLALFSAVASLGMPAPGRDANAQARQAVHRSVDRQPARATAAAVVVASTAP